MTNKLQGPTPPTSSPDPLSAEVERALFKRFWTWLAIVGTVVIAVVSGFSVIASQAINSLVIDRVSLAMEKVNEVEKRALDSAFAIAADQARSTAAVAASAAAADAAKARSEEGARAVSSLQDKIKSLPDVDSLVRSTQAIADSIVTKPEFIAEVTSGIGSKTDALERALGGGRILALAQVKDGKLLYNSGGVLFEATTGTISFSNPKGLTFFPMISDTQEGPYITTIHWIQKIEQPNRFVVRQKALDTGDRTWPPTNFTAIVVGYETSLK